MATEHDSKDQAARLRVGVITGSIRPGRQSTTVAEWVCAAPAPSLDLHLIELAGIGLPLVATFDAFVLVSPEYNHSTSPALKNALDHLYWEWRDKPVAFVGYGIDGGTRAVEHLRSVAAELGMAGVGPQVSISLRADYADGRLEPRSFQSDARQRMLDQLAAWATALRALRLRTASPGSRGRPALDDPSVRAAAAAAVDQLVAGLQEGLDRASADAYDRQFAADILWGSPYGVALSGYGALNAAHRMLMAGGVAPPSRYQVVRLMSPVPGVAIAHVRRNDLTPNEQFSEMAMYVLVERGGEWWLAAGQNTPIAERRG